jgi:hypothetical protein
MHSDIPALTGIGTHELSVRAGEDSSCLRPRGHCGRPSHPQGYHLSLTTLDGLSIA